jgi:CHAT domain-containing protein
MACHAVFDPQSPLRSRLFLAPGSAPGAIETDPRKSDGNLYAWEIYLDDHHGTDLVALAACETLLPAMDRIKSTLAAQSGSNPEDVELSSEQARDIVAGDELVGLARAFLSSGAASVLGTIWEARGLAVAEILEKMCTHRQAGETWSKSLCLAQRALIGDASEAVWYWGPYQFIGVWR